MKTIVKRMSVQLVKESSHKYDVPKTLRCPEDAVEFIKNVIDFDAIPCELFIVVPIDSKSKPLCVTIVTKGTLNCPLYILAKSFSLVYWQTRQLALSSIIIQVATQHRAVKTRQSRNGL